MRSKVVLTYKRKRVFSRTAHSPLSLSSDKPTKVSDSKALANFDNHEESVGQPTMQMQNKDTKHRICHEYCKDREGENMQQGEECDSRHCGQSSEKDFSLSNQIQISTLKQKALSQEPHLKLIASHPNVPSEVKSGLEYEAKCKETFLNEDNGKDRKMSNEDKFKETSHGIESVPISSKVSEGIVHILQAKEPSISGTFSSKERTKLNKDGYGALCNNLGTNRRFPSTLITYYRRSKRKKDNDANDIIASECADRCGFVTPLAKKCSLDVKTEKKSTDDSSISNSCSFSNPDAAVEMDVEDHLHSPPGAQILRSSHGITLSEEKACIGIQDNSRVPQELSSKEDVYISRNKSSLTSLDLSISQTAFRDIDCNILPVDFDSDENHLPRPLEDVHNSLGSTNDCNKNFPTVYGFPVRDWSDKGKFVLESTPLKNSCIQLFPESKSNGTFQLANEPEKLTRLVPSTLHSSRVHNFSHHSEQMPDGPVADYSSLNEWAHLNPREPFPDCLPSTSNRPSSLSAHLMMLDNILSRARSKFEFPTTWSEDELDCLWIGVRRHGVNNWDAIVRDPRLQFSPWKTARGLAEKWREEQYRLFHSPPISQVMYAGRPDLLSNHTVGFLYPRAKGLVDEFRIPPGSQQYPLHGPRPQRRPSAPFMNLTKDGQFQEPVTNGYLPKALPHWLREAVRTPPRSLGLVRNVVGSPKLDRPRDSQGPWRNTENSPVQRRTDHLQNCCQANNKQDGLIVITSDASSEETISDDHSIRH